MLANARNLPDHDLNNAIEDLRTALDRADGATESHVYFTYLEIALGEISRARTIAWDLLDPAERAATVAYLDSCGVPHPLLRGTDDLRLSA